MEDWSGLVLVIGLPLWVVVSIYVTGKLAASRGKSVPKWRLLGMWFFPFSALYLLLSSNEREAPE